MKQPQIVNTVIGLALILALLVADVKAGDSMTEAMQVDEDITEKLQEQYGSATAIEKNAVIPMTTDTPMQTLDGSSSFNTNFICDNANTVADVLLLPQQNGNVNIAHIRQDTDGDGNLDTYQTPNWQLSAVCTNGHMHCTDVDNPATCRSYKWVANQQDFLITRQEAPMTQLGGCYCINEGCGANLATTNLNLILGDLGAGIAAAITEKHNTFSLSAVETSGTQVILKGTNTSSCRPTNAAVLGEEDITSITGSDYARNSAQLRQDGFAAQENSSLYNIIKNSPATSEDSYQYKDCSIQRVVKEERVEFTDIISFDNGSGGIVKTDEDTLRLVIGRQGNNYWSGNCAYYTERSRFFVHKPDRIRSAVLKKATFDDWMQIHLLGPKGDYSHVWNGPYGNWTDPDAPVPGRCELSTSWQQVPNKDFKPLLSEIGPVEFRVRAEVSGGGEAYVLGDIDVDISCRVQDDQITDNCNTYQSNDQCTLFEEKVDGVTTFSNGISTGLTPLANATAEACDTPQMRDWNRKERRYRCETDTSYNFDKGFERMEYVQSESTTGTFKDKTYNSETESYQTASGALNHLSFDESTCTKTCKTRKEKPLIDLTLDGTVGSQHNKNTGYDYFYYECPEDNRCPVGDGEEMIKACQCINEFAEAAAILQTLRLAGQDIICSNGAKEHP
jgi:hypothetical protein